MAETIYAPINVKARDGRFGEEFRISAKSERLIAFIQAHTNKTGYINFGMTKRRSTGKFGETHSVVLDTWEPTRGGRAAAAGAPNDDDDIPF